MKYGELIKNGVVTNNPVFVQLLSLCPLLAVTTSAINGLTMGLATTAMMICASTAISLVRKILPDEIRIAAAVVIVAGFVTVLQLYLEAYAPAELRESLGIFIPLIVVNCILFGRIEAFASKNGFVASAVDAFGMGAGLTLGLVVIGVFRELFGSGSFFGLVLQPVSSSHMLIMIMPAGAFFTLGIIILLIKYSKIKKGGNQ